MDGKSYIKDYFREKNIFITGGTGFVGKALIEKLLRSCPDLNKIYVLVREKKGKKLQERVDEILSSPVFSVLKKCLPENMNKIIPIAGNTTEIGLVNRAEQRKSIDKLHHLKSIANVLQGHFYTIFESDECGAGQIRLALLKLPLIDIKPPHFLTSLSYGCKSMNDQDFLSLGLSSEDMSFLINHINVFVHCAASVNFNDFLKNAIFANLRSVREAALLALEMKELDVFIHVSTAYCNIDNKEVVEEILYPSHGNWKDAISIAESCDTDTLNVLSRKYIGVFPNTYTYTKHLAEHCVNDMLLGKVNTIIYRPTVVAPTTVDPYQGWIENFNGPVGLLVGYLTGLVRICYIGKDVKLDLVPVDYVIKSMITAVWYTASFGTKCKLDIYHGSTNTLFSKNAQDLIENQEMINWDRPLRQCIWFPNAKVTDCWYYYFINVLLFHVMPAFFVDLALKASGHSPLLFKLQKKIYLASMALVPFTFNEWFFVNTNTLSLIEKIPKEEMPDFNFKFLPTSKNDFYQYLLSSANHVAVHLLKEDKIKDRVHTRNLRMYYLDLVCRVIFYGLLIWYMFFKINIIGIIWNIFYNYLDNL